VIACRQSSRLRPTTLNNFLPAGLGPIGVAVIFGVDELMDMGRTCVNLIGNCLATVVARWEGEFDDHLEGKKSVSVMNRFC
jgi:Na+/H+-dicarboxylate symporter